MVRDGLVILAMRVTFPFLFSEMMGGAFGSVSAWPGTLFGQR